MSEPRTYPHGVPCWVDTEQPDTAAACEFYGGLFGWSFEDAVPAGAPGAYLIAKLDGRDVAAIAPPEGNEPVAWNTYIAVDSADAAAAAVGAAGGVTLMEPVDVGPGGRFAVCADPRGARFRLWQAGRRLGAQVVNDAGTWNFSDLRTSDAGLARRFYAPLFGWDVDDLGFAQMIRRPGYGDHLEATVDPDIRKRQKGVGAPPGFEDVVAWVAPADDGPDHWHVTFAVADRDDAAARAERLGATIVASEDSDWTRMALVRDPQGAELTLSQFTPPTDS
jgi:predicted enzyme related to lactoylglutathione lyase